MGNPLFRMNPIMQMKNQIQQLRQNPQGIADYLKKSGHITDEQYQAIKGMNGDYRQIGQYLLNSAPQNMQGQIENQVNSLQNQM